MFFPPDGSRLQDVSVEVIFIDTDSTLTKANLKATGMIGVTNPTLDLTKWFHITFNSNNDFEFCFNKDFTFDYDFSKTLCRIVIDHPKVKFGYVIRNVPKASLLLFLKEKSFDFDVLLKSPKDVEYFLTKKPLDN